MATSSKFNKRRAVEYHEVISGSEERIYKTPKKRFARETLSLLQSSGATLEETSTSGNGKAVMKEEIDSDASSNIEVGDDILNIDDDYDSDENCSYNDLKVGRLKKEDGSFNNHQHAEITSDEMGETFSGLAKENRIDNMSNVNNNSVAVGSIRKERSVGGCGNSRVEESVGGVGSSEVICAWCNQLGPKSFTLLTMQGSKAFCSEICFNQCRRASFKKSKVCDWCKQVRTTINYVDFQDGEQQLQFCGDKCLNNYRMNIFCKETAEHLNSSEQLFTSKQNGDDLITPELWLNSDPTTSMITSGLCHHRNNHQHVTSSHNLDVTNATLPDSHRKLSSPSSLSPHTSDSDAPISNASTKSSNMTSMREGMSTSSTRQHQQIRERQRTFGNIKADCTSSKRSNTSIKRSSRHILNNQAHPIPVRSPTPAITSSLSTPSSSVPLTSLPLPPPSLHLPPPLSSLLSLPPLPHLSSLPFLHTLGLDLALAARAGEHHNHQNQRLANTVAAMSAAGSDSHHLLECDDISPLHDGNSINHEPSSPHLEPTCLVTSPTRQLPPRQPLSSSQPETAASKSQPTASSSSQPAPHYLPPITVIIPHPTFVPVPIPMPIPIPILIPMDEEGKVIRIPRKYRNESREPTDGSSSPIDLSPTAQSTNKTSTTTIGLSSPTSEKNEG